MSFIQEIFKGRTLGRILMNRVLERELPKLNGKVLDLAGGKNPSYQHFFSEGAEVVRGDIKGGAETYIDFNKPLSFEDNSFDSVLLLNALYIADDVQALLKEMKRVLKKEGALLLMTPLIANEMPEPHDYVRFTHEGLSREMGEAGFRDIHIERIGERGSAAFHLLHPFFLFNVVRLCAYPFALLLDKLVPEKVKKEHPTPLGYIVRARK